MGEAPMTVAMVIEFSNLFQSYWSQGWYETLTYTYAFLSTLKPEDFVAVVAYDLRPEILSDFSTDKRKAQEAMQRLRIAAFSEFQDEDRRPPRQQNLPASMWKETRTYKLAFHTSPGSNRIGTSC